MKYAMPITFDIPRLHKMIQRGPEVSAKGAKPETAEFKLNLLSATGTAILLAAIAAAVAMGIGLRESARIYVQTIWRVRFSLLTIAAMLALGNVTKYSGTDATLGLALAHTGSLYPFFGTLLGWLGVALTGSDTATNELLRSLTTNTAFRMSNNTTTMAPASCAPATVP